MIGNDLVDLKVASVESNWKRPRFLDKVFTIEEQQLIMNSKNQHQTVWLLWSMKEAAYKINVQQFGKRFYNPKKLVCHLSSSTIGYVTIENRTYYTRSAISKNYIYTVASLNYLENYLDEIIWLIKSLILSIDCVVILSRKLLFPSKLNIISLLSASQLL